MTETRRDEFRVGPRIVWRRKNARRCLGPAALARRLKYDVCVGRDARDGHGTKVRVYRANRPARDMPAARLSMFCDVSGSSAPLFRSFRAPTYGETCTRVSRGCRGRAIVARGKPPRNRSPMCRGRFNKSRFNKSERRNRRRVWKREDADNERRQYAPLPRLG